MQSTPLFYKRNACPELWKTSRSYICYVWRPERDYLCSRLHGSSCTSYAHAWTAERPRLQTFSFNLTNRGPLLKNPTSVGERSSQRPQSAGVCRTPAALGGGPGSQQTGALAGSPGSAALGRHLLSPVFRVPCPNHSSWDYSLTPFAAEAFLWGPPVPPAAARPRPGAPQPGSPPSYLLARPGHRDSRSAASLRTCPFFGLQACLFRQGNITSRKARGRGGTAAGRAGQGGQRGSGVARLGPPDTPTPLPDPRNGLASTARGQHRSVAGAMLRHCLLLLALLKFRGPFLIKQAGSSVVLLLTLLKDHTPFNKNSWEAEQVLKGKYVPLRIWWDFSAACWLAPLTRRKCFLFALSTAAQ